MLKACVSNEMNRSKSRAILTESVLDTDEDLSSHKLMSDDVNHPHGMSLTGPTYKVNIVVEEFKTRTMAFRFHWSGKDALQH